MLGLVGEMRVADGSENGVMAEELLYLDQSNAGLDQVRCKAVAPLQRAAEAPLCRVPDYAESKQLRYWSRAIRDSVVGMVQNVPSSSSLRKAGSWSLVDSGRRRRRGA